MFELMPFDRGERNLFDYLNNIERNFFGDFGSSVSQFRTDILDKGDHYLLQAELPGFSKEDIHIHLDGDRLTISAEHKEQSEEKKEGQFVRRERRYGSFARSFDITGIDAAGICAAYQSGVLELKLPKQQAQVPPTRQIEIQ